MHTIVLALVTGGIPAALATGWLLRRSTVQLRREHAAEVAVEPAESTVRDGAVRAYRNPAQRAAHPAHPAVRGEGLPFDEAVAQALQVANGKDDQPKEPPKDPSNPNDPVTRPKQHSADCRCSRCRTSSELEGTPLAGPVEEGAKLRCPTCKSTTCKGCSVYGPVAAAQAIKALWAELSTDQQFALAHDQLLDKTAPPASLVERSYR